jgi:ATP-binding cassette subfamily B (MDR/TAP) protein 1
MIAFFSVLFGGLNLAQAGPGFSALSTARVAMAKILSVVRRVSPIDPLEKNGKVLDEVRGEIEFHKVAFAYPQRPELKVYDGLSMKIEAGTTVALVGPSGSGKSSAVALIERFYDVLEGSVTLDGVDVRSLRVSWLRGQIGLVSQEPVLFSGSIFENIVYGKPGGASVEEVEAAAKMANAHSFIADFPEGYQTQVGEKGVQLSGGQKQRIAIARAIVRDPKILILDEATSALDSTSERVVQEALDRLLEQKKRTTIIIAHRISTIRNANKIVVLSSGTVVEQGTYDELVELNGHFARLAKSTQH